MKPEDEKTPPPEKVEIRPVSGAEIEFLTGPEKPARGTAAEAASSEGVSEPADEPSTAKAKARKKEAEAKLHKECKELKKEVESSKSALRELERRAASLEELAGSWEKEAAELKDKYVRSLAEMDNLRKRLVREKNEFFQYALAELLKDILRAMDSFELALKMSEGAEGSSLREGVELIYKQLADIVRKQGVTPVIQDDRFFDPAVHQAVITEESAEVTEPMVGEEIQKGYLLNDRLLRPAMVKVLLPKKD